jgi:1,4-alpha-glucan branching enzyme
MKKQTHKNGNGHGSQTIRIEFAHPTAAAVAIAGTFNDWHADSAPMLKVGDGRWLKDLALPAGRYEYRFVVDGAWIAGSESLARGHKP